MSGEINSKLTAIATTLGNITQKLADKTAGKVSTTDYATTTKAGIVKPDGTTIFVGDNGVLSAKTSSLEGLTASVAELNYSKGVTSSIQTQLNAKVNSADLKTVATSGSYDDLSDKPSIPTVTDTYSATSSNAMSGKAVASAISGKANSATTLAGYGITDAYTKTEVDNKVSSVYKYKGSKSTYAQLPTTGNVTGDVWNIETADATHGIKAGDNVAWTGSAWDVLAGTVDLSAYAKTADLKTVATSGSYNDLTDKPSIPSAVTESTVSGWGFTKNAGTVTKVNNVAPVDGNVTISIPSQISDLDGSDVLVKNTDIAAANKLGLVAGGNWLTVNQTTGKLECGELTKAQFDSADGKIFVGKTTLNNVIAGKQNTISDLETIRSGAALGATALQSFTETDPIYTADKPTLALKSEIPDVSGFAVASDLAKVATSGSYTDLTNKPSIPTITDTYSATSGNGMSGKAVASAISGKANSADLKTVATTGSYNDLTDKPSIPSEVTETTVSGWGFTKNVGTVTKVNNVAPVNGNVTISIPTITDTYSATSGNGMSGKAVASAISGKADASSLATVATSGSYTDLTNKPSIPSAVTESTVSNWGFTKNTGTVSAVKMNGGPLSVVDGTVDLGTVITAHQDISGKANSADLATVATSGSYTDLSNKPSIPTVTDTYSATSSNAMSGKAVASAISGKADASDIPTNYVPNTRTINNKALTGNITLSAADVGATTMAAVEAKGYLTQHQSLANYYNKTEIDGKLSGAMHFKGTVDKVSDLPTGATTGDMYNVKSTGANYAWDGTAWDKLSENIDLSGVVPTTRTVNGKALSANITLNASDVGATTMSAVEAKGYLVASDIAGKADSSSLATVATSGSYTDLTNKPTIPSAVTETTVSGWGFTKNTGTLTGVKMNGAAKTVTAGVVDLGTVITAHQDISGKSDVGHKHVASDITSGLATVATSGSYDDLTGKPTIPAAVTETTVSGWGFTKNTGTYSKPSTGIPRTDLASAVQTSLGKADTALQSITSANVTTALGFTPYNATNPNGYTSNTGTITGIKMNGASKGTSGVVDLGTVLTAHQDISGKTNEADLESAIDSLTTQLNNAAK